MREDINMVSTPLGRQQEENDLELDNNEILMLEIFRDLKLKDDQKTN